MPLMRTGDTNPRGQLYALPFLRVECVRVGREVNSLLKKYPEPETYTEEFFYSHGFNPKTLDNAKTISSVKLCLDLLTSSHVAFHKDYLDFMNMESRNFSSLNLRLCKLEKAAKRHEWARKRGMKLR